MESHWSKGGRKRFAKATRSRGHQRVQYWRQWHQRQADRNRQIPKSWNKLGNSNWRNILVRGHKWQLRRGRSLRLMQSYNTGWEASIAMRGKEESRIRCWTRQQRQPSQRNNTKHWILGRYRRPKRGQLERASRNWWGIRDQRRSSSCSQLCFQMVMKSSRGSIRHMRGKVFVSFISFHQKKIGNYVNKKGRIDVLQFFTITRKSFPPCGS